MPEDLNMNLYINLFLDMQIYVCVASNAKWSSIWDRSVGYNIADRCAFIQLPEGICTSRNKHESTTADNIEIRVANF
jgi:hypothetical protein